MPSRKHRSRLFNFVVVPVVLILLGAFALSAASVFENLRLAKATSQILEFIRTVRFFMSQQKTSSFSAGEDVWASMVRLGQIPESAASSNPWGGMLRATATANAAMRIESYLPSQDCRRMALYFLGLGPVELGLLSVEAQPDQEASWYAVYPSPDIEPDAAIKAACGTMRYSQLALVFRIK
jgi:hypothetical protein